MAVPKALLRLFRLIPARERRGGLGLFGLMVAGAAADLVSIGALVPFLTRLSGGSSDPGDLSLGAAAALFIGAALQVSSGLH